MKFPNYKKRGLKQILSFLLILTLVAGPVVGLVPRSVLAAETPVTSYIGATSDVHGNTTGLSTWLTKLYDSGITTLNHFLFGGDFEYTESQNHVTAANCVSSVKSNFSGVEVFTARGNHDVSNVANFPDKGATPITNATSSNIGYNTGLVYNGSDYAIYVMSVDGYTQTFRAEDLTALPGALASAGSSKPIFVVCHFPIHAYSSRTATNSKDLLDILNLHSNVVFLWGHNHSQNDPEYGKVRIAGYDMPYSTSNSMAINFTYASMGAMYNDVNGARGLLVTLKKYSDKTDLTLEYRDLTGAKAPGSPYSVTIGENTPNSAPAYELATSVEVGETYVIVAKTGSSGSYVYKALTNTQKSTNYLEGATVSVAGNFVVAEGVNDKMLWTFRADGSKYNAQSVETNKYLSRKSAGTTVLSTSTSASSDTKINWSYGSNNLSITGNSGDYNLYYNDTSNYFYTQSAAPNNIYLYKLTTGEAPATYTVTFNSNGGSAVTAITGIALNGTITLPTAPTKAGFEFAGWYQEAGLTNAFTSSTPVTANIAVYAKWTEAVPGTTTYELATSVEDGGVYVIVARTGSVDKALTNTVASTNFLAGTTVTISGNAVVASGVTANMLWTLTSNEDTYRVTNGGLDKYLQRTSGQTGIKVSSDTSSEYTKIDWTPASNNLTIVGHSGSYNLFYDTTNNYFNTQSTAPNNIYLYKLTTGEAPATYTVTFNSNGGSAVSAITGIALNGTITLPTAPTKAGFEFAGWYQEAGLTNAFTSSTPVTANITVYAKWTEVPAATYTVTFNSNGGSAVSAITGIALNGTITLPTAPTKAGFEFAGWYQEAGLTNAFTSSTPVTANITVYAKWTEVPAETYTVTFNSNGGSAVTAITGIALNGTITLPTAPTKAGFEFAGWYQEAGLTNAFTSSTPVTANITVYAKWTEVPAATYTVTFNSNGGSAVSAITGIALNGTITLPTAPTKAGFEFAGWYQEAGLTNAFTSSTPVTANITVYAKWTEAVPGTTTYELATSVEDGGVYVIVARTGSVDKALTNTVASTNFLAGTTVTISGNAVVASGVTANMLWTFTASNGKYKLTNSSLTSYLQRTSGQTGIKVSSDTSSQYTKIEWAHAANNLTIVGNSGSYNLFYDTSNNYFNTQSDAPDNIYLYKLITGEAPATYTVTFNSNGGSAVSAITGIALNGTITLPTAPTKAGFEFAGWYQEAGLTNAFTSSTPVTANITVYAKWTEVPAETYTVTFNSNGGSAVTAITGIALNGTITLPTAPTKAGFEFAGWYQEAGLTNAFTSSTPVTANITVYAKWTEVPAATYTVTFNSNGGSAVSVITGIALNGTITLPTAPTKAGFEFAGWYQEAGLTNAFTSSTPVTANITVYAKWTEAVPGTTTYELATSVEDGGVYVIVARTGSVDKALTNTVASTNFLAGTTVTVSGNAVVASGVTANMLWTFTASNGKYKLTNSSLTSYLQRTSGQTGIKVSSDTSSEYTKIEWAYASNELSVVGHTDTYNLFYDTSNNYFNTRSAVPNNIYLYKLTTGEAPATYTVTFNSNGGSAVSAITGIALNGTITLPTAPTKAGFEFAGWYQEAGLTNAFTSSTPVTANITVYAKWTEVPAATYTVTFNSNGGSAVSAITGIALNGTITLPTAPTKAGFEFAGWYQEAGLTNAFTSSTPVTANITVYAKWTEVPAATYTVTFNSNGGSAVSAITGIALNGTITLPTAPTKAGFEFAGWYQEAGLTNAFTSSTPVTANITVYAKWTEVPAATYTVTFNSNGGSAVSAITGIALNGTITLPTAPTKAGFEFAGWYQEAGLTNAFTSSTPVTANITVYAKWTEVPAATYTVTFNSNGGSAVSAITGIALNGTITLPTAPTKAGFEFAGWYQEAGLTNAFTSSTPVTANIAVYAKWTALPPEMDFDDVSEDDWFFIPVKYVFDNKLMVGTWENIFSPNGSFTRAMLVTILYRMENSPAATGENIFTDVESDMWYYDAILWAHQNGLVAGIGDNLFAPNMDISREQFAVMLYRYADYKGHDMSVRSNLAGFTDVDQISPYARYAIEWAVGEKIINGKGNGILDPRGSATRAEAATMLMNFLEN